MWISRQDEAGFPNFKSVETARRYFKKRYGEKYNVGDSENLGDFRCYFDDVDGQPVQIMEYEDGAIMIHVVY